MLHKLQGVVLNTVNYNDKYFLVHIYTDIFGRVTYMVAKTSGKKTGVKRALFSPLSVLDMEVDHRPSRDIQRIKEVRSAFSIHSVSSHSVKSAMVFFLSEFLSKTLKDVNENQNLFRYLVHSIEILEYSDKSIANYHLAFILHLTRFLGFFPNLEDYSDDDWFDMLNGVFTDRQPLHSHYLNVYDSRGLAKLARLNYENMHLFRFSRAERNNIVNKIIEYYRIHLHDFPVLKSPEVLHELF